jgi:predicted nucleotidyltransferase
VVLAELPRRVAGDLLARLDRALPGRIEGFYVVGSASMGAFRPSRSDIDFVAIVDGELRGAELRRLRTLHAGRWASALIRDTAIRWRWPLVCNGIYIAPGDLSRSPLDVTPLAGHVAGRFRVAPPTGFDVNPVTWHVLARHGIALRGPDRDRLAVRTDDAELRMWVRANLNGNWRHWAARTARAGRGPAIIPPRLQAASGVLGAPRLHYTLTTGEIATKEAAAHYALEVFEHRWHGLIDDALRWWHGEASAPSYRRHPRRRLLDAVEFVECVIAEGNRLFADVVS